MLCHPYKVRRIFNMNNYFSQTTNITSLDLCSHQEKKLPFTTHNYTNL